MLGALDRRSALCTIRGMANEILAAREELGMSREEFASMVGVSRWAVMRWENEKSRVPEPTRRLIQVQLAQHRRREFSAIVPTGGN